MNFRKVSALASVAVLAFAACSNTGGGTPSPAASSGGGGGSSAPSIQSATNLVLQATYNPLLNSITIKVVSP